MRHELNLFRSSRGFSLAWCLAGLVFSGLGSASPAMGADAWLVRDGRPQAEIVIAEEPARATRLAAQELQTYLEKISGARLEIVTEPGDGLAQIFVGISPYTEELGLDTDGLAYGAFRMASGPDWLALLGPDENYEPAEPWGRSRQRSEQARMNQEWDEITGQIFWNPFHSLYRFYNEDLDIWAFDDRGTLHAVHEFLRDLGVRWYSPGDQGEVIPEKPNIELPKVERVVEPDFKMRSVGWWYEFVGVSEEDALWRLRLGLHEGHDVAGITQQVHGMKYVHRRQEVRDAHPEYYAVWGGERATDHKDSGAPCLSSEELFQKHLAYARAVFDHFDEPMISIDMVDGYSRGVCECELCQGQAEPERGALGRMSEYVWGYVNRVAQALYESHPDRMVSGLAYGAYREPPETIEEFSPNLALILMPSRRSMDDPDALAEDEAIRAAWLEKLPSGQLMTFTNFIHNWPRSAWAGVPVYFPRATAAYLRSVRGVVDGEIFGVYEHIRPEEHDWDSLAVPHLDLYVTSRLWWDVDQDLDDLLEEYYRLFFGPAEAEMRAYIEYCEANYERMQREPEPIGKAIELLETAQAAVESGSIYDERIQAIARYTSGLEHLQAQLERSREDVPRARLLPNRALGGKELDGRLDNPDYWPEVRTLPLTDVETGDSVSSDLRTWVRVFWADGAVYFGIWCGESNMDLVKAAAAADETLDWAEGDYVEVLLETLTHSYYQIVVTPSGVLFDSDLSEQGVGEAWSSNAEAAVHLGENYWSAEIRIPLEGEGARDLDPRTGVDGRMPTRTFTWHFNVGRQRVRDGEVERFAFSPTGSPGFDVVERFAEMWGSTDLR